MTTAVSGPLLYDIAAPSGRILSHQTGRTGADLNPLWTSARARIAIIGQPRRDGTITATIFSSRGQVLLGIPPRTLQAAW
ncbi:MAG TPA: hypothetical protein VFQ44_16155 [Streptosporangiaceae bacterium]|nr:hypothetical protein [Streptosporangiaceae bacterium]